MGGKNDVQKSILARDHSLGREYLDEGEAVTLDGFSWQDPFEQNNGRPSKAGINGRKSSLPPGPKLSPTGSGGPPPPPPAYPSISSMSSDQYRYSSQGSLGPPPPPPLPGAYAHMAASGEHHRYHSGRYESWGSLPPPPPPIPGYGYPQHSHSGSGNWGYPEHSLGQNPLTHASISQSAPYGAFDGRMGSWGPPADGRSWGPPPPPQQPPGAGYSPHYHRSSGGPPPPPPAYAPPPQQPTASGGPSVGSPSRLMHPPSPPYSVDPAVASAWSGQDPTEIAKTWSAGSGSSGGGGVGSEGYDRFRAAGPKNGAPGVAVDRNATAAPVAESRPDLIKRMTSNQNETLETKPDLKGPSVKRAALNRDNSTAANRLKEKYVPGYRNRPFNLEREMRQLSQTFEQSTLDATATGVKPKTMSDADKMSTIDHIAMDLMAKPVCFSGQSRSSTIEALALDLDDDLFFRPGTVERSRTMEEVFAELRDGVSKPASLASMDRLTTNDFLDIVNEPIGEDDDLVSPTKRYDVAT